MGKFANVEKMVSLSMENWGQATELGLTGIRVRRAVGNRLETSDGHQFINMASCSYLGLGQHPKILQGAISAVQREGTLWPAVSRARIGPVLLAQVEERLAALFGCQAIATISCTAASSGVLPVLASGHLTRQVKPLMVFDKNSHFSMNVMKASCGDETEVVTCEHNDVDFIEDACKSHPVVAYVADGAYSMGGNAPVPELLALQERYGLFLYMDDSHSLSIYGKHGVGLVRSQMDELSDRTIIVGSLAKAFGATGAVVMLGDRRQREMLDYVGGPIGWSQGLNSAGLGAALASAELHFTDELVQLQERLRSTMSFFDTTIPTVNAGNGLPIRIIDLVDVDRATEAAAAIYRRGFYTSAVFFPIVARGHAGLRAMGRADLAEADIVAFCAALQEATAPAALDRLSAR